MTKANGTSPDYVHEKMVIGIGSLCGDGTFNERLENAALDIHTLEAEDLDGEMQADLAYILRWTSDNLREGRLIRTPNETERREIVEKMIWLLVETSRMQEGDSV